MYARCALFFVALLAIAGQVSAEDKALTLKPVEVLYPQVAEVGDYGPIPRGTNFDGKYAAVEYQIDQITGKNQMVVREVYAKVRFVVEGIDTSKLVTGREFDLKGYFKVTRTAKRGTSTYLVLVAETDDERKHRETEERKRKK